MLGREQRLLQGHVMLRIIILPEYAVAPESAYIDRDIRQLIFKTRKGLPYRLLYTIDDEVVLALHIRGPGQPLLKADELRDDP